MLKDERLNSIPLQPLPTPARPYSDSQHSVDYVQHPSPYTQQPTTFNQYQDQAAVGYGQPMQPDDDSDIAKELPQKIRFSNWISEINFSRKQSIDKSSFYLWTDTDLITSLSQTLIKAMSLSEFPKFPNIYCQIIKIDFQIEALSELAERINVTLVTTACSIPFVISPG